jgi:hypothetical protein
MAGLIAEIRIMGWIKTASLSMNFPRQSGDIPAATDYDGDGKADVAIFRSGTGICKEALKTLRALHSAQRVIFRLLPFLDSRVATRRLNYRIGELPKSFKIK